MYGYEIFHDDMMKQMLHMIHTGGCQHAYIFEGADGLGKHNAASLLAQAITCRDKQHAPCGTCPSCIQARAGTSPDIIHIDSGNKKSIGVERIREITADASIKPFESDKKVYIIDAGDLLTEQSQNAFLKTLEEPPEYITFIIIVTNANILLQTVLSRCVLIRFSPVSEEALYRYIETKYPEETRKQFLAKYAGGIPGVVDSIIASETFEILRQDAFEAMTGLISPHIISAYAVAEFLEKNKERTEQVLDFWLGFLRDILLIQADSEALVINADRLEQLKTRAAKLDDKFVVYAIEHLLRAKTMQRRYVNTRAMALNLALSIKEGW